MPRDSVGGMPRPFFRSLPLIIGVALCAYFGFHLAFGERGYGHLAALEAELARTQSTYAALKDQRLAWEDKVARLRPQSLDLDALEEVARSVLGYQLMGETVILLHD